MIKVFGRFWGLAPSPRPERPSGPVQWVDIAPFLYESAGVLVPAKKVRPARWLRAGVGELISVGWAGVLGGALTTSPPSRGWRRFAPGLGGGSATPGRVFWVAPPPTALFTTLDALGSLASYLCC